MGRHVARAQRGQRRRAGQRDGARDHPRRPAQPRVHRARHGRLRGLRGRDRAVHARARRGAQRRAGRRDPGRRAHLRARRPRADLLDARHHGAPQRGRQRPRPHQPGAAHRARRPLRLGAQPAARPEQRAGRRRHGRDPQPAARLPGPGDRPGGGREVRARLGREAQAQVRLAHDRDVRGGRQRRAATMFVLGENPVQSDADSHHVRKLLESLDHLVVQDIFRTRRPRSPTSCCPPRRAGARRRAR